MIGNSDDSINFPHKLILSNRQVANLREAFANNSSTDKTWFPPKNRFKFLDFSRTFNEISGLSRILM